VARARGAWSPATHFSIHGEISAKATGRSSDDLSFEGSPLELFMKGAFDRTLTPGCTAEMINP